MLPISVLLSYIAGVLLTGSLLAYPIHLLDAAFELNVGYEKVLSRSVVLASVLMLWPMFRFLTISLELVGLKPWRSVSLGRGEMLGVAVVLPVAMLMFALEIRVLDPRISITAGMFFSIVLMGGMTGLVVGFIEEVIFRGLIFSLLRESTHAVAASLLTSVLYALVHFLDVPENYHAVEIGWMSGFEYLANAFATLAHPAEYWDSFVSLFLLGLALNWVRVRANLYWCVGIRQECSFLSF